MCASLCSFTVSTVFNAGFFDSIASAIFLDDLRCTGAETNLLHCNYDYRVIDCNHGKDAGVKCYTRSMCGLIHVHVDICINM